MSIDNINWSLLFGVLGGVIFVGASIAQWSEKKEEEKRARRSEQNANKAQEELKLLQVENLEKSEELKNAYKEIAHLQKEIKNELTGAGSVPLVKIKSSKQISSSGKDYVIVWFDVINNGKYPIKGFKGRIYDAWGLEMLKYGVKHFRDGMSVGFTSNTEDDVKNYYPIYHFDLGTIILQKSYPLHLTTLCFDSLDGNIYPYNIELQWDQGSIIYFIELIAKKGKVELGSVDLMYNGKKHSDYSDFLTYN